jgi:hypothetical protein
MGESWELFFTEENLLIYSERMVESENHYYVTINIVTELDKDHQWMLLPGSQNTRKITL